MIRVIKIKQMADKKLVQVPNSTRSTSNPAIIDVIKAPKKVAEKMSYKEKSELEQLNKSMPILEVKKATLTNELNNTTEDYNTITALSAQLASVTAELETAELRWLELSEKLQVVRFF